MRQAEKQLHHTQTKGHTWWFELKNNLEVACIIYSFTSLITTVKIRTKAFQLLASLSQAVCETHLITACLLSVSHNYLHSSSRLWQSTVYCKLTEFLTDNSRSSETKLQTFLLPEWRRKHLGRCVLFLRSSAWKCILNAKETVSSHACVTVFTQNKYFIFFRFFNSSPLH